jgi:sirohydrochlorin cobaltochelatase/precorrin-2/cobalt-factor-2 C20-methyltransferase
MKSGKKLAKLLDFLEQELASGRNLEIWAVSNCGMQNERCFEGIKECRKADGYLTIVIVKEGV